MIREDTYQRNQKKMIEEKRRGAWLYVKLIGAYFCLAGVITVLLLWFIRN